VGRVEGIFIAESAGEEMVELIRASLIVGVGILGDRYALGTGAYSRSMPKKKRELSIISINDIEGANRILGPNKGFPPQKTRRNLIISGFKLNESLVGKVMEIGQSARVRITGGCPPCNRPSKLSGIPGFKKAFAERGGVRAEILVGGVIRVGLPVFLLESESKLEASK